MAADRKSGAELIAGEGASSRDRTLFVVGDKKQSIYSFQGADVAAFDQKRGHFGSRLAGGRALRKARWSIPSGRPAPC
jgi:ATP-dependent helicase/nuclease subunit A